MTNGYLESVIVLVIGGALAASGYATILQSAEKMLRLPLAGRIYEAFGQKDTVRFVNVCGVFMLLSGAALLGMAAIGVLNNLGAMGVTLK